MVNRSYADSFLFQTTAISEGGEGAAVAKACRKTHAGDQLLTGGRGPRPPSREIGGKSPQK